MNMIFIKSLKSFIAVLVFLGLVAAAYIFPVYRIPILFFPFILSLPFFKNKKRRNICITYFVVAWLLLFKYESIRFFILQNAFPKIEFTKTKFLFPPAGWIMFYQVGDSAGYTEVYGVKDGVPRLIDPHDIVRTRTIMYDNIHRNILSSVSNRQMGPAFCQFLKRRFAYYDEFLVATVYYPSLTENPHRQIQQIQYRCTE